MKVLALLVLGIMHPFITLFSQRYYETLLDIGTL